MSLKKSKLLSLLAGNFLLSFFLFLCITDCGAQDAPFQAKEKIKRIDNLIYKQPDSARVIIRQIIDHKGLHDTVYAIANTYQGYYHLLKNDLDSSIYYYNKAIAYSEGWTSHNARALRNMATPYKKKGNYEKSLKLLAEAENKYESINDQKGLATVYGEIASNYNLMLKSHEAIPYLLKAIAILKNGKNQQTLIPIKQSLANTYMNVANYEFAIDLYKEVLPSFRANGQMKNYYLTLINYSECLTSVGKTKEARKALEEALPGLEGYNDADLVAQAYSCIGRTLTIEKDYTASEKYYRKAYEIALASNSPRLLSVARLYVITLNYLFRKDDAIRIIEFIDKHPARAKANLDEIANWERMKARVYKGVDKNDQAVAAMAKTIELLDTLDKIQKKDVTIKLQGEYQRDYQRSKNDELKQINATLKEEKSENDRFKFIRIIIPLSILLLLAIYFLYTTRLHRKKMALSRSAAEQLLKDRETTIRISTKLKQDIEEKHDIIQLGSSAIENIQANIGTIVKELNNGLQQPGPTDVKDLMQGLEQMVADDNYRRLFRKAFRESHAAFQQRLSERYPDLNKKELFFCALLNLNMSQKDIAMIMQVVPETVKKKKYRLKKKMGIGADVDIVRVLAGI
jgi:tetratricopeptide (TPR) repeat protein